MPQEPSEQLNITVDKNEITKKGKLLAGILLVAFTIAPMALIIGLWPNKMPVENSEGFYQNHLFRMVLIMNNDNYSGPQIHINTILFLLVALAGFMGSMVHLATSFTNYIGAGRFKRDWALWYIVKPFTAACVAIIFYMVLNAGLLGGSSSGGVGINPYGIVILAALAGLFTDKATLKLEEVFSILFQPKDPRPDRMDQQNIKITGFDPKKLLLNQDNTITITGENLDTGKLAVKINGEDVQNIKIEKNALSFSYKVAEQLAHEKKLTISVFDGVRLLHTGEFELDGAQSDDNTGEEDEPVNLEELIKG